MTDAPLTISNGFSDSESSMAAALFWQAFSGKLGLLMGPEPRALGFLREVMNPDFAICARDVSGQLLGLAGFKTQQGALVGGGFGDLRRHYGLWGALWRAPLLATLERDLEAGVLLMDGIFVAPAARGRGVGTALLDAVKTRARTLGLASVRLDVIDTNPRARALYEREGFSPGPVMTTGPLRPLFGFKSATEMRWSA